jgi:myo-inositol catabolism protein IolC
MTPEQLVVFLRQMATDQADQRAKTADIDWCRGFHEGRELAFNQAAQWLKESLAEQAGRAQEAEEFA